MSKIDEIRAREQAATPGPWGCWHKDIDFSGSNGTINFGNFDSIIHRNHHQNICLVLRRENAEFISYAREDIPYLLSKIDCLTTEVEKAWEQLHIEIENEQELQAKVERLDAELAMYRKAEQPELLSLEQLKQMHDQWVWIEGFPVIEGISDHFEYERDGWHRVDAKDEWLNGVGAGSSFEWVKMKHIRAYTHRPRMEP